jgi:hypothetical protein
VATRSSTACRWAAAAASSATSSATATSATTSACPATSRHPWYLESLAAVRVAAARHGKACGLLVGDGEAAAAKRAEAWTFVAVGSDASLLAASLAAELLRQQLWLLCWQLAGDVGTRKAHTLSSASAAGASCRTRSSDSDQTVATRR